jgi:hypothetical protein
MESIKITGTVQQEVTISPKTLGWALIRHVSELAGVDDDAGCDWMTDYKFHTYLSGGYEVSVIPELGRLVDAANVLIYGEVLKVQDTFTLNQ